MNNLHKMIQATRDKNPAEFQSIFEDEISTRLFEAVKEYKADVVAEMFIGEEEEDITEEMIDQYINTLSEEDYERFIKEDLTEDEIDQHRKAIKKAVNKGAYTSKRAIGGALAGGALAYKATGGNLAATAAGAAAGGLLGAGSKKISNANKINQRERIKRHMQTMGGAGKV